MRRRLETLAICAVASFCLSPLAVAAETPVLSLDFTLEPGTVAGSYRASVLVSDAVSGEVLSAPRLSFRAGDLANASSQLPSGDVVELEVSVTGEGAEASASYVARLIRDGKPLNLQKGKITLGQGPESGAVDHEGSRSQSSR